MGIRFKIGLIMILFIWVSNSEAQTAMGMINREWQRNQQLFDTTNPTKSYNIQTSEFENLEGFNLIKKSAGKIKFEILPVGITLQSNTHHPSGINDGSMIPAAGFQTQITGGIKLSSGRFSLQLQPEFVNAANPDFDGFPTFHYNFLWNRYYKYLNQSDLPEQFGSGAYQKIFAGQSSIKYSTKDWSVGISTENIWWGPGMQNSLMMSYNAPGFLHATFNSTKPFQTKMGAFEWQFIFGQLTNSGILPPDTNRVFEGHFIYQPKKEENRYITGAVIDWQPKWIKGLFLGATSVSYLYQSEAYRLADLLPVDGFIQSNTAKLAHKASLGSLFVRYAMPSELAEFYIEYGRSNKTPSIFNGIGDKLIPKGFIFGLRKLFQLHQKGTFIQIATEFAQLQLDDAKLLLDSNSTSWYTHPYVRQGYTNQGQSLGAGIGPGSNSQRLEVAWLRGFNKIGLVFERVVRNNDFYYYAYVPSGDFNRHWIDLSTTFVGQWQFKKIMIAANLGIIRSLNYEWFSMPPDQNSGSYFKGGWDVLNFHGQISIRYRL
jgi:hypothetical protein